MTEADVLWEYRQIQQLKNPSTGTDSYAEDDSYEEWQRSLGVTPEAIKELTHG